MKPWFLYLILVLVSGTAYANDELCEEALGEISRHLDSHRTPHLRIHTENGPEIVVLRGGPAEVSDLAGALDPLGRQVRQGPTVWNDPDIVAMYQKRDPNNPDSHPALYPSRNTIETGKIDGATEHEQFHVTTDVMRERGEPSEYDLSVKSAMQALPIRGVEDLYSGHIPGDESPGRYPIVREKVDAIASALPDATQREVAREHADALVKILDYNQRLADPFENLATTARDDIKRARANQKGPRGVRGWAQRLRESVAGHVSPPQFTVQHISFRIERRPNGEPYVVGEVVYDNFHVLEFPLMDRNGLKWVEAQGVPIPKANETSLKAYITLPLKAETIPTGNGPSVWAAQEREEAKQKLLDLVYARMEQAEGKYAELGRHHAEMRAIADKIRNSSDMSEIELHQLTRDLRRAYEAYRIEAESDGQRQEIVAPARRRAG